VTSIGNSAFWGCGSLTSVVIPESVTSIGGAAFSYCSGLTSVVIPEGVTSIGNSAFRYCSGLTSVVIPEGVTSIGESAFEGCSGLTSVVIPEGVTSIGNSAFERCSSLTSVVIPEGVTSIGGAAFKACSSLTSVVIPESVTSIGDSAFEYCSSLETVFYGGTEEDREQMTIEDSNAPLVEAKWHYEVEKVELASGETGWHCGVDCCDKTFYIDGTEVTKITPAISQPSNSVATITEPEGGWKEGTNTFTVSCDKACYVAVSYDGGETYTKLPASAVEDGYSFTAENMDSNTIVAVVVVGDANSNGRVDSLDARIAFVALSKGTDDPLRAIAVDANGNGRIDALDVRKIFKAASSIPLTW